MDHATQITPENTQNCEPVAGCRPVSGGLAVQYDRRWFIVDDTGTWLSQQQVPALSEVEASFRYGYLALRAPGMLRMDIPLEVEEDDDSVARTVVVGGAPVPVVDEGDLLAAWWSNFLQRLCRLVKRHPPDAALAWPDRMQP